MKCKKCGEVNEPVNAEGVCWICEFQERFGG
jgi:hypothetical protein